MSKLGMMDGWHGDEHEMEPDYRLFDFNDGSDDEYDRWKEEQIFNYNMEVNYDS